MLTFLSRWLGAVQLFLGLRRAQAQLPGGANVLVLARPSSAFSAGESAAAPVCGSRPRIALVRDPRRASSHPDHSDNKVAVLFRVGATPFVAGQGARLYSLDLFRRERSTPPRPHHPLAAS